MDSPRPRHTPLNLNDIVTHHHKGHDLWVFAYASLIWRPEFEPAEQRLAKVYGHHRALKMWSRINRGTHERPGLVFALLPGGSCQGMAMRIPRDDVELALLRLWQREMPTDTYTPRWLPAHTDEGTVQALAFTLPRHHPQITGTLTPQQYATIFAHSRGRYGTTLDYALETLHGLQAMGLADAALARLLKPYG
jgi:glutathione-specific gamma-glutamylcyclotransferase